MTIVEWPEEAQSILTQSTETRRRVNASLVVGGVVLTLLIAGSFIVPAVSPYPTSRTNPLNSLQGPSGHHFFGTDDSGFDVFTRVAYAPRVDLPLVAGGVALALVVGTLLGLIAGGLRGLAGELVNRVVDLAQAFPALVLALAVVTLSGNKRSSILLVLALVQAPIFMRLMRSRVLVIRELRYTEAARNLGNGPIRIALRHTPPNAAGPIVVQAGISSSVSLLAVAGLAFLGAGVQPPTPEWGSMIQTGRGDIVTGQWWTVTFPGLALAITVASFTLLAIGIERFRELG